MNDFDDRVARLEEHLVTTLPTADDYLNQAEEYLANVRAREAQASSVLDKAMVELDKASARHALFYAKRSRRLEAEECLYPAEAGGDE